MNQSFMNNNYDVIIVGAGASGIASAHTLSQQGLKILVLEARSQNLWIRLCIFLVKRLSRAQIAAP